MRLGLRVWLGATLVALLANAAHALTPSASADPTAAPSASAQATVSVSSARSADSGLDGAQSSPAQRIADAITELDVVRARRLIDEAGADSQSIALERARLAIYVGDCDSASAILSSPNLSRTAEGADLGVLARSCAGATAAGVVVDDAAAGVWLRLQDGDDRALVPFVVDVVVRARAAIERDLGTDLPRPLRIELVRDLFSLAAVSGLPLSAAETTGAVAVARWGRVTMISPRATPSGYAWEDTLAHEITHLVISRATRDHAPLWLQEGLAKRAETRWRPERPFDQRVDPSDVARAALRSGLSFDVEQLGPSIAMLPSPDAAQVAFAQVTSFVQHLIAVLGEPGLRLLLADLRGTGSAERSLYSVTGYPMSYWLADWQSRLVAPAESRRGAEPLPGPVDVSRPVRLGDLLLARGHSGPAARELQPAAAIARRAASVRTRYARALLDSGEASTARAALGTLSDVGDGEGLWFALGGRFAAEAGDAQTADQAFGLAIGLDPLEEGVACEGHIANSSAQAHTPGDARRAALCLAARQNSRPAP